MNDFIVPPGSLERTSSKRVPPHNIEAEQSVLGSILLKNKGFLQVNEYISADDFYRDAHKIIFTAMVELFDRSEPQDMLTLTSYLTDTNQLESVGGASYLATLTHAVPVTANIESYSRIIRQKSVLRNLINTASDIAQRCFEEQDDIDQLVDEAEQSIFEIAGNKSATEFTPLRSIIPESFKTVEKLYERKELITGVPTGYTELDKMTAGLQPSDLVILAGRPSMGKTSLALNIAQHAALVDKTGVAIFSLEMSKDQLAMRLLSSVGRIDSQKIRTGRLQNEDWPHLSRAAGMLSEAPIHIDDTPALSIPEMRSKMRRLASGNDIGLVLVDYLQLMRGRVSENRTQEISDISRSLKALAKEHDVPVLALSQLNRGLESRTDKRPMMADLRESGAIEQDADVICFIYRDEVYNKNEDNPDKGIAEIIIGKQRNGPTGLTRLFFKKEYTMFENLSSYDEPHLHSS
ncbi:MAG: replicative DNA helicase [Desulfofustis sp.]|nr:replicative DNA helicase [Desulfofustis sp.]NNF47013.1 replicative DNA helicase [Desulfofustis sp.]NNK58533.1 replicative DNA helicase [Desulfofustis sp.]